MKENNLHYTKEYELVFACELLDQNVIDSEEDVFCEDGKEYNVAKYIDMFNKRITPLLVCFSRDIRGRILIDDPKNRQYFTKEEATLVSGEPDEPGDQDDINDVLRMEDREVKFWIEHPEWIPPYTNECGMDWEAIKKYYLDRIEEERRLGIDKIKEGETFAAAKKPVVTITNVENDKELANYKLDAKFPDKDAVCIGPFTAFSIEDS